MPCVGNIAVFPSIVVVLFLVFEISRLCSPLTRLDMDLDRSNILLQSYHK